MISVKIELETDSEQFQIAQLRITNLSGPIHGEDEDEAQYIAEFSLVEGDELSLMSRPFSFRRKEFNVFALIHQAISTLTVEELRLNDKARSADMAWRQQGTLSALQAWSRRLRDH